MPKFHLDLQVEFIKFKKMKPFFIWNAVMIKILLSAINFIHKYM